MDNASTPSKSNTSKGFWIFVIIGIILIIIGGIWLFWTNKLTQTQPVAISQTQPTSNQSATTPSSTSQTTTINNDADLRTASNELDNTNLDSIDTILNQNDTDASQF